MHTKQHDVSWTPPRGNACLEACAKQHIVFQAGRWAYWFTTILMSILFLFKVANMLLASYNEGADLYLETRRTIDVCQNIEGSSRTLKDFCESVKREERTPVRYAVAQTATRLYWGALISLQSVLSSTYTLVLVAIASAFLGYWISSRGLLNVMTPKWFAAPPVQIEERLRGLDHRMSTAEAVLTKKQQ